MASGSWESRADRIASVVARVRLRMVAVALAAGLLLAVAAVLGLLLPDMIATRLRKRYLDPNERKRMSRQKEAS